MHKRVQTAHRNTRTGIFSHYYLEDDLQLQPMSRQKHQSVAGLTEVIGAGSSLGDVDERSASRDVKNLVVAEGDGDIPEAPRHLSAGGVPPTAHSAPVHHGARAEDSITTFSLAERRRRGSE